jgi:hypothetical protein
MYSRIPASLTLSGVGHGRPLLPHVDAVRVDVLDPVAEQKPQRRFHGVHDGTAAAVAAASPVVEGSKDARMALRTGLYSSMAGALFVAVRKPVV